MRRFFRILLVSILCVVLLAGCSNKTSSSKEDTSSNNTSSNTGEDTATTSSDASSAVVSLTSLKAEFKEEDYYNSQIPSDATTITLNKTSAKVEGSGATVKGSVITISSKGAYVIKGTLEDGQIIVNAGDKDDVQIILNGVTLNCQDSSPIYVQKADKVVISLQKGTENTLSDTKNYILKDKDSKEPNATIFSKADLVINGSGTLKIDANYNVAINSRDNLKITEANLKITSVDDGIIGHDMLAMKNANLTLTTDGDGIKSTNSDDKKKGFVDISGGSFVIKTGTDGIQAASTILISDSEMNIITGGGSKNAASHAGNDNFGNRGDWNKDNANVTNNTSSDNTTNTKETSSSKAIKAATVITITSGKFTIDSCDDSIHSNSGVLISGGTLNLSAGDDGIHASKELDITGGTINIKKSYEGIESSLINIKEGKIHVTSSDDGINVSGGTDTTSTNAGAGQNGMNEISGDSLNISGGYLYVNAEGDGLDSNNSMTISGGTIIVNGPTNDGNGSLDYNGTFKISGGYLIAAGSSGMAQAPSDTSSQYSVATVFTETQNADTLVHIEDSKGNTIATFAPAKTFSSIVVSSPDIKKGETYTVSYGGKSTGKEVNGYYSSGTYSGGTKLDKVKVSSAVAWIGSAPQTGGFGGKGGHMGGGPGRGMGGVPQNNQDNTTNSTTDTSN